MQAYLDVGLLLAAIIPSTKGSSAANQLLREIGAPFPLNFLHRLQVENLLVQLQTSSDKARQQTGSEGQRLWGNYFAEGVFRPTPADWDGAFRVALTWNNQYPGTPPPFLLLLHPALATVSGATSFLSFDPRSREVARAAGLSIRPEKL